MLKVIEFLFIVAIAVGAVIGAVVSLFALGAILDIAEHPEALKGRLEGIFRRPLAPPRTPGKDHYYRPYWAGK
jgi:hypothetical protein